jgi:predicted enzyme related to lactoylglutathione lyase
MVEFSAHEVGSPCWVDLTTPDIEASKSFYTGLFGWDTRDQLDDQGDHVYTSFERSGKRVAGAAAAPPDMAGMPSMWNTYIAVDDVDATAEAVTAAGGTVLVPPMEVMDAGWMAVFADSTGAAFSVWRAGEHPGAELCNEPGTWSWNELLSRDVEAARTFYQQVFGWEYDAQDMGPTGTYHVIRGGRHGGLGGLMSMPPGVPDEAPNHWLVYFTITDIDATVSAVTELAGQVGQEPFQAPGVGTIAVIHDSTGGTFSVLQPES